MAEIVYVYTKPRREFGKAPKGWGDAPGKILETIQGTDHGGNYVPRSPLTTGLDTVKYCSEHSAQTDTAVVLPSSAQHTQGGWPKDVDFTEPADTARYRKKAEKVRPILSFARAPPARVCGVLPPPPFAAVARRRRRPPPARPHTAHPSPH